ncbi:MAG: MOSC domain-containing protein, partial [Cyanobacteria bacterium J06627_15]
FAEDTWAKIRIGEVTFTVAKGCDRCSIPGVDQATGVADKEPLPTLATYRRWQGKIWFGQNLVQENLGQLKVNDPVEVLAYRD